MVVLTELPPGLIRGLPRSDQRAIKAIVGKPVLFTEYDEWGRVELEFRDQRGGIHFIYVEPKFIRRAE